MQTKRIKAVQSKIENPVLICKPEHLFYLTGVYFSDPTFLLLFPSNGKRSAPPVLFEGTLESVRGIKNDRLKNIGNYLKPRSVLAAEGYLNLLEQRFIKKHARGIKFEITEPVVEKLRLVKDASEIAALQKVADITAEVFTLLKKELRKHPYTEAEVARFIRHTGIKLGADSESFPAIVASGRNAARPHHIPTNAVIKRGESLVLDFGFKLNGYCSDFTRTLFLGSVPKKLAAMYEATEQAYTSALNGVRAGLAGAVVDEMARSVLRDNGFEKYFIHSLGHGTGLEVHEAPSLAPLRENVLRDHMVFSIEPGVYIPRYGGIRIEDLVYLENGAPRLFFKAPTKLKDAIL